MRQGVPESQSPIGTRYLDDRARLYAGAPDHELTGAKAITEYATAICVPGL
jgi:hypothetical protein